MPANKTNKEMTNALIDRFHQIKSINVRRQDMNGSRNVGSQGNAKLSILGIVVEW